jgi:hypothetical protein
VVPPQSTSVSLPFFTPSVQLAAEQVFKVGSQTLSTQSDPTRHVSPSAHGEHVAPPQSTSVSSASFTPSAQCAATHAPVPSQTVPPPSVHVVPLAAFVVPHTLPVHVLLLQTVPVGAQSDAWLHWTQLPVPSHTDPPLSLQGAPVVASFVPQVLAVHVADLHFVAGMGQSAGALHTTQLPLPSQTFPLLFVQSVPMFALAVPQQPVPQVSTTQAVVC